MYKNTTLEIGESIDTRFLSVPFDNDKWVRYEANSNNKITKLNVYAGATGELNRDALPHGTVLSKKVKSSKIFLGLYDDYRYGLEKFERANIAIVAPLKWEGNVPFGLCFEQSILYSNI